MKDQKFLELIKDEKSVLIIASKRLDFDCIGSGLILKKYLESLGKEVTFVFPIKLSQEAKGHYSFLPYFNEVIDHDPREILSRKSFDVVVLVDGPTLSQFYDCSQDMKNPLDLSKCRQVIIIDHHFVNSQELEGYAIHSTKVSSAAELVLTEIIPDEFIDSDIATLGYAAIVGDTGNFKWALHPETFKIAAELLSKGAKAMEILDKFIFSRSPLYLQMLAYDIENSEYREDLGTSFIFLPYKKIKEDKIDDRKLYFLKAAFQEDLARTVEGYPRGIIVYEKELGKVSLSARGNTLHNKINLAKIMMEMGKNGGGHFNSCGADVDGKFEEVKEKLIGLIKKELES